MLSCIFTIVCDEYTHLYIYVYIIYIRFLYIFLPINMSRNIYSVTYNYILYRTLISMQNISPCQVQRCDVEG